MTTFPTLVRTASPSGETRYLLGHPFLDRYLEFVAGRARPNTLRAVAFDLKAFFAVIDKDPLEVAAVDVFEFLAHQRGDRMVVRISDRESGLSARTIARRLSSVSGLYVVTRRCGLIRCPVACRLDARVAPSDLGRCLWCGCRARCRGCCHLPRLTD